MKGKVIWFSSEKGYGFIEGEDEKEYFVHISALAEGTFIHEKGSVSFELIKTGRGIQAQN